MDKNDDTTALRNSSEEAIGLASAHSEDTQSTKRVNTAITDESLYLVMAMWMEMFPDEHEQSTSSHRQELGNVEESSNKIGCVLVSQNGRVSGVDRSRGGIHGVVRLLVKCHDRAEGCKVFVSRKPCSYCAKLLVQARVTVVAYPPVEPELPDDSKDEKRVEYLFKVGHITERVFVPKVKPELVATANEELLARGISLQDIQEYCRKVLGRFWSEDWMKRLASDSGEDLKIERMDREFRELMQWFARVYLPFEKGVKFRLSASCAQFVNGKTGQKSCDFDPENDKNHALVAKHVLALAAMTTQRTVEPRTGVGAVIMKNNDLVAVGWNEFPCKQIEEEFHRASDRERDEKYPFFIHAEQSALLSRHVTDVTGGIVFVTKTPCHECVPLLKVAGIETVVLATSLEPIREKYRLDYEVFPSELGKGTFVCYEAVR